MEIRISAGYVAVEKMPLSVLFCSGSPRLGDKRRPHFFY
jgi:hypothetical protein